MLDASLQMFHTQLMSATLDIQMLDKFDGSWFAPANVELFTALEAPRHTHSFVHPVFADRRGDARPIVLSLRCSEPGCEACVALDYLPTA